MKMIDSEKPDLILMQEPYEYQNRPVGIEKKYRIFTAGNGKHRAAIIITNSKIDAILITKVSDENTVFLEITHEQMKYFAASMYFDIEDQIENNFNKADELIQLVKDGRILIATDSNSRSKTWHDVKTNYRGRKLEEYLASKQLHIINEESDRCTFNNSRGSSNVDLTIANNSLIADVNEWEISTEESLSDHNYLKYKIGAGANNNNTYNNFQGAKYIITENKTFTFEKN
jgi:hypothetical protein